MQRRISRDFDSRFDRLFGRRSIHRFSNCFVQFSFGQFRVWLRRYDCRLRCGSSFRFESNEELVLFLVLFSFSGAHINPAVSIALLTLRAVTPLQCFSYIVSRKKSIGIQKTKGFFRSVSFLKNSSVLLLARPSFSVVISTRSTSSTVEFVK